MALVIQFTSKEWYLNVVNALKFLVKNMNLPSIVEHIQVIMNEQARGQNIREMFHQLRLLKHRKSNRVEKRAVHYAMLCK